MAIKISDEYVYAEAPSADYPGGSFRNDTTGTTGDGTPLEKKWANDFLGFFQALLANAGIVPNGAPDTAIASQYFEALQSLLWAPGDTKFIFSSTPGVHWLELNGQTIGDASSGANGRAAADTLGLFTHLWPLAAGSLGMYTSAGAVVGRGASAAADFAAHKRIALPDMRGESPIGWDHGRGVDPGRVLGSWAAGQVGLHTHANTTPTLITDSNSGGDSHYYGPLTDSGPGGSGENRVRGVAGMFVIRY